MSEGNIFYFIKITSSNDTFLSTGKNMEMFKLTISFTV